MAVMVDPLREYPHVRWSVKHWCHLAADSGFDELHAFARRLGIPARGFQGDHYDLPPELRAAGRIVPHPVFPANPGWGARAIETEDDLRDVVALLRGNYDRVVARHGVPAPA